MPFLRTLFALALLAGCSPASDAPDHAALRADWQAWTAERDTFFASDSGPLADSARAAFSGLPLYAYDSTFAVAVALVPELAQDTVAFPTSTGELRPMVRAGSLAFRLGGIDRRLTAYAHVGPGARPGQLFVPFRDETSGRETYGGGRYLDLDASDGLRALDFNRAYHPYCVYAPEFSCPLPPPENTLGVQVEAGERFAVDA